MRRSALVIAALLPTLAVGACGGGGSGGGSSSNAPPKYDGKPVTITLWHGFTSREAGILNGVVKDFEKAHPTIKVKTVGGVTDDKIVAALRGGNPPDVAQSFSTDNTGAFCGSGGWIDLKPYMDRDKVAVAQFPKAVQTYTTFDGHRCALPMMADVYGLYYNKDMFKKAGITSPPKTFSELTADAKKLTVKNGDGSIKVAGFDPTFGFYESVHAHYAPLFNAQWQDASGKSTLATDPWMKLLRWQKDLVDWYGYSKLTKFNAGAGEEFSASNAFEKGKLAMNIDGEFRTAFIADEAPHLNYGVAPMPVDDSQPELYGGGYVTGNIIGIPKTAKNKAAAWELMKYLATDPHALATLTNGLRNVPTTATGLKSPEIKADGNFQPFLDIFENEHTQTNPPTAIGSANQELFQNFLAKWQAGKVPDSKLQSGLAGVDQQIDAQIENATAGQAP
jgi:multiple sugar transport system substrate-binding protein